MQVSKTESVVGKKPLEEEQGSKDEKLDSLQNKLVKVSKEHKEKVNMLEQEKKEVVVKCKAFDAQVAELKGAVYGRAQSEAEMNIKNAEANSNIKILEAKLADLQASSKDRKAETTAKETKGVDAKSAEPELQKSQKNISDKPEIQVASTLPLPRRARNTEKQLNEKAHLSDEEPAKDANAKQSRGERGREKKRQGGNSSNLSWLLNLKPIHPLTASSSIYLFWRVLKAGWQFQLFGRILTDIAKKWVTSCYLIVIRTLLLQTLMSSSRGFNTFQSLHLDPKEIVKCALKHICMHYFR